MERRTVEGTEQWFRGLPVSGVAEVRLSSDAPVLFVPYLRSPRADSRAPSGDGARVSAAVGRLDGGGDHTAVPELDGQTSSVEPIEARPRYAPAMTIAAEIRGGTQDLAEVESTEQARTTWRLVEQVGVLSRPTRAPFWWDAWVGLEESTQDAPMFFADTGFDWRLLRSRLRLWWFLDAGLATGPIDGVDLTSARVRTSLLLDRRYGMWQPSARLALGARGLLAGDWPDGAPRTTRPRLWSTYAENHPWYAAPSLELRILPGPWWGIDVGATARSNAVFESSFFDCIGADAAVHLGRPFGWLSLVGDIEYRFADTHREDAYWAPSLGARGGLTMWAGRDVALQLRGGVSHHFAFAETTGWLALRLYGSHDRGMRDPRPSTTRFRHGWEWWQDGNAERQVERRADRADERRAEEAR